MTQDELDVLADSCWEEHNGLNTFNHVKFAALVTAHEREACAKVCDEQFEKYGCVADKCAAAIRARSNK